MRNDYQDHLQSVVYSVPRRFGMGTILSAITLFAVLAAAARGFGLSPLDLGAVAAFVTLVAVAQMVARHAPRVASAIVGASFAVVILAAAFASEGGYQLIEIAHPVQFLWTVVFGALVGYIVGTLLAALYLVADSVTRWIPGVTTVPASRGAER